MCAAEQSCSISSWMDCWLCGTRCEENLYISDTSRLARSSSFAPKLRKFFESYGIRLHFVENGMKSGTSGFDLQHTFQAFIDEQFSEQLGEKVSRAQVGLVLKGYHPSGRCYGYHHVNEEHPTKIGKWNRPVVTRFTMTQRRLRAFCSKSWHAYRSPVRFPRLTFVPIPNGSF